jgi:hypothetical protein
VASLRNDGTGGGALQQTASAILLEELEVLAWYFLSPDTLVCTPFDRTGSWLR